MKLVSVHLKNFKKHQDLKVEFSEGLTVICGSNYSGKTTVQEAILFAMYGTLSVPGGKKVITSRSGGSPEVELVLSDKGTKKVVNRGGSHASVHVDGNLVASGPAVVTDYFVEAVGMNLEMFSLLHTAGPHSIFAILAYSETKLNKIMETATGVDIVDQTIYESRRLSTHYTNLSLREVGDESTLKDLMSKKLGLEQSLSEQAQHISEHTSRIEQLRKDVEVARERYFTLRSGRKAWKDYDEQVQELEARLQTSAHRLEALETQDVESLKKAHTEAKQREASETALREEHGKRQALLSSLRRTVEGLDRELEEVSEKIRALETSSEYQSCEEDLEGALLEQEAELERTVESRTRLSDKVLQLKASLKDGVCQACLRPFEGFDPDQVREEVSVLEISLHETETKKGRLSEICFDLRSQIEKRHRLTKDLEKHKARYADTLVRKRQADADLEHALSQNTLPDIQSQAQYDDLKKLVVSLELQLSQAEKAENARRTLVKEQEQAKKALSEAENPDCERVSEEALTESFAHLNDEEHTLTVESSQLEMSQQKYAVGYAEYQRVEGEISKLEQSLKDKETFSKKAKDMGDLGGFLSSNRSAFMEKAWNDSMALISQFVSDCTKGEITRVSRGTGSASQTFFYEEEGRELPVAAASGYQKAVLGVAVRLAILATIRSEAGFLLLDEPTAGATDENSLGMMQALHTTGLQVVSVSHRDLDATVAQTVIRL